MFQIQCKFLLGIKKISLQSQILRAFFQSLNQGWLGAEVFCSSGLHTRPKVPKSQLIPRFLWHKSAKQCPTNESTSEKDSQPLWQFSVTLDHFDPSFFFLTPLKTSLGLFHLTALILGHLSEQVLYLLWCNFDHWPNLFSFGKRPGAWNLFHFGIFVPFFHDDGTWKEHPSLVSCLLG